jgi:hypothetical protein
MSKWIVEVSILVGKWQKFDTKDTKAEAEIVAKFLRLGAPDKDAVRIREVLPSNK